ncbi:hypothetical protein E2562_027882 [Oryza meyeriana var. granulata]|uniref:Uncharacterized protein n=1 Tax=Oryza meyeriana var. granulata TaxID=110450 RepID=A0A6G1CTR9_9ORYZ|nr:hypothetical protein E2562_027882 [Oryza meyeriana var. granulata]
MADDAIRYLERINQQQQHRRLLLLLLDSGRRFMLLGAAILMCELLTMSAPTPTPSHPGPYVFVAFLLWLLGAALAMLSLVAGQFPAFAAVAAAIATKLRNYLLGGV